MKTTNIFILVLAAFLLGISSCKEEKTNRVTSDDTVPPGQPLEVTYKPLFGGARFFYSLPDDEDLIGRAHV